VCSSDLHDIAARGHVPLLVGGTMLYFRALTQGLSDLPAADAAVRTQIEAQAAREGWPAMHAHLAQVDPVSAARLHPNDRQRVQRALEVVRATGRPLSEQQGGPAGPRELEFCRLVLMPPDRAELHARIEQRLDRMFAQGFVAEVAALHARGDLHPDLPSVRAVGYRQVWGHLDGEYSLDEARARALYATRQLAKRQITWLRSEHDPCLLNPAAPDTVERAIRHFVT
jgi:tRNA dimethylallyltransferase